MTFQDYLKAVEKYYLTTPKMRYGQSIYNVLVDVKPSIAGKIRGSDDDPFYTLEPLKIDGALAFIEANWDLPEEPCPA